MWRRVFSLIRKELLANWIDRQNRFMLLLVPIAQILIFSFAATQDVRNVRIAILDRAGGVPARRLIAKFEGSPTFTSVLRVSSVSDIAPVLDSQSAAMILHIAPGFSGDIASNTPSTIQLILDGRRSNTAQILEGYAETIIATFNAGLPAARQQQQSQGVVVSRIWFNPNLEPLWSSVPALFAVLSAVVGLMASAQSVARERELGTFEQLLVSPLSALEIVTAKAAAALIIALISSTGVLLVGLFVLDVPFRGSLALLYVAAAVFLMSIIGVGIFISSLAASQQQAVIGSFTFLAPAIILSGFASPIENMPEWLQELTQVDPVRHFVAISKGIFLKDVPASFVLAHIWPMALITAATLTAGAWLFRRKLQ